MLPSSHRAPINEIAGLLASPDEKPSAPVDAMLLADAFAEFISVSARLEGSYRELQQEVAQLSLELAARNSALSASIAENERMRVALEQIVDSMPCGVLVLDGDGAVSMINPESARMLGLEGRPDRPPRDLEEVTRWSGVQLETFYQDETAGEAEQEFSHADAEGKRWLGVRKRKLFAAVDPQQGTPAQTILILRDITAHKQAEQEREAARKSVALAEVAALLAHEIRNPLASLELFAGLIAEDPERRAEWTSHLRAGIRSLAGTVTNVLSFHSLERMPRTEIDLAASIQAAVEFTRPIAEQASLALTFSCTEDAAPIMLLANQGALQQLVLNLVSNAIRHTRPGGSIDVAVSSAGTRARVCFTDSGCGIAAEHLPNIFNPGFSGSGNTCGLGLAVCRQIATQHEGTIRVLSEPGEGTTFIVELPQL